jgi:pimeloyl-ACP methyl ester carboxylesterase
MAKDIKAVIQALQLEPLFLIGWSLAVPEVINYAYHFGSKSLKGLVLIEIKGSSPEESPQIFALGRDWAI